MFVGLGELRLPNNPSIQSSKSVYESDILEEKCKAQEKLTLCRFDITSENSTAVGLGNYFNVLTCC